MPGLYSKLVEAKKGFISDTAIPVSSDSPPSHTKIQKIPSTSEEARLPSRRQPTFKHTQVESE